MATRYYNNCNDQNHSLWSSHHSCHGAVIRFSTSQHHPQPPQQIQEKHDPTNATQPVPGNDSQAVVADATDPQLTIQRAKQQLLETSKHRVTLHNEKEPIHIWAEQVVGVTINRDLGTLEDKLKLSITHLEFGKVSMARCLSLWGPEHSSWAKGLCEDAILRINNRWRATTEPILNAF